MGHPGLKTHRCPPPAGQDKVADKLGDDELLKPRTHRVDSHASFLHVGHFDDVHPEGGGEGP